MTRDYLRLTLPFSLAIAGWINAALADEYKISGEVMVRQPEANLVAARDLKFSVHCGDKQEFQTRGETNGGKFAVTVQAPPCDDGIIIAFQTDDRRDGRAFGPYLIKEDYKLPPLIVYPSGHTPATAEAIASLRLAERLANMQDESDTEFDQDIWSLASARRVILFARIGNLLSGEDAFINSVGVYLDEFKLPPVPYRGANQLFGVKQIDVLDGPQGTYFGRNSLGGAIKLTTAPPTRAFGGSISVSGENYENAGQMFNLTGDLNLPLSDAVKARGVFSYENSSGLVKNITARGTDDSGHENLSALLKGVIHKADHTSIELTLVLFHEKQGTDETVPSGVLDLTTTDTFQIGDAIDPDTGFWPNNRNRLSHDLDEETTIDSWAAILNFEHDISDSLLFTATAGVVDTQRTQLMDYDSIGDADIISRRNLYDWLSWSTELRLEGGNDSVDWVAGVLYANDEQEQDNKVAVGSEPTITVQGMRFLPPFPQGLGLALNDEAFEVESLAIFGDIVWHVNDALDLSAGARFTDDEVMNAVAAFGIAPSCGCPPGPGFFESFINVPRPIAQATESFSDVSPRVSLRYNVNDDTSIYGTVSKGYNAGGTSVGNNTNADGTPPLLVPFDKETLWHYSLRLDSRLAKGRVRLNASLLFLRWNDLQLENFRLLTPADLSSEFKQTQNVRDARATGLELEITALVRGGLTVGAGFSLYDSEIKSAQMFELTGGFMVDVQGLELPRTPEFTANIVAQYDWQVGGNQIWIRGEFMHRDGYYSDLEGLTNEQTRGPSPNQGLVRNLRSEFPYLSPGYDVFNLWAGYDTDEFSVVGYIQNVTDEKYYNSTQESFGFSGMRLRPHPLVIGMNIKFPF